MKLYSDETQHQAVRALDLFVVSCVARVEVPAAIWRKQRIGELDVADAALLSRDFEADWAAAGAEGGRFVVIGLPSGLLEQASSLVASHGLRAHNAIQLASGMAARRADRGCDSFGCFDGELRRAAAVEGFTLVPNDLA